MRSVEEYLKLCENLHPRFGIGDVSLLDTPDGINRLVDNYFYVFQQTEKILKSKNILEIGFNRGASSLLFFYLFENVKVTSVDIDGFPHRSVSYFNENYKDRFIGIHESSRNIRLEGNFDLMFIDGDHSWEGIKNDLELGLSLNIKYFLLDDYGSLASESLNIKKALRSYSFDVLEYRNPILLIEMFNDSKTT